MSTLLDHWSGRLNQAIHSIRFRLALWFVFLLALVLVVFSIFVYTRQARDLRAESQNRLEDKARQIQALLRPDHEEFSDNGFRLPDSASNQPLLQEGEVLVITGPGGELLQTWGPIQLAAARQLAVYGVQQGLEQHLYDYTVLSATASSQGTREEYRFLITPFVVENHVLGFIVLGRPVDPGHQLTRLAWTLALATLLMLALAFAGGYWLADVAMRPVKTITQAAKEISETDLNRRLNLASRDEIGELAATFDSMLSRLQAAFDRQRQFTADASHELRTPLTIINLEANHALTSRKSDQEYERTLRVIQSENDFMTRMVNELLTLARMDAGRAKLKLETLDLSSVALEVVERLAPIANRNYVELITGELPEVRVQADHAYLVQMIANLVDNAIKYTTGKGGHVWVSTGTQPVNGKQAGFLRITDDGPGIPEDHLAHLFERFYRIDEARAREDGEIPEDQDGQSVPGGSGLGLAIVEGIAKAHGGSVGVTSKVGEGSVFEVFLPLSSLAQTTPAQNHKKQ